MTTSESDAHPDAYLLRLGQKEWGMWSLFVKGHSAREIARTYGVEPVVVRRTLDACRKSFRPEDIDDVRMHMLEELRMASQMMWGIAEQPGAPVTAGKDGLVVTDPDTGAVVRDYSARISAVNTIVKLQESARKLIGVDAPVKVDVKHESESIDGRLLDLARELGIPLDGDAVDGGTGAPAIEAEAERLDEKREEGE